MKCAQGRPTIRYSEAFKLQVVEEVERGEVSSYEEAREKYGIGGHATVRRWVRQYGREQSLRKVVRVEKPEERDQIKKLKKEIAELEKALAKTRVSECLTESYLEIACERLGMSEEEFKKKVAGKQSAERSSEQE